MLDKVFSLYGSDSLQDEIFWDDQATVGVEYTVRDSQFPNVDHGKSAILFKSAADFDTWLEEKRDWIRGTDYDFSLRYDRYDWDLGPSLVCSGSLGA